MDCRMRCRHQIELNDQVLALRSPPDIGRDLGSPFRRRVVWQDGRVRRLPNAKAWEYVRAVEWKGQSEQGFGSGKFSTLIARLYPRWSARSTGPMDRPILSNVNDRSSLVGIGDRSKGTAEGTAEPAISLFSERLCPSSSPSILQCQTAITNIIAPAVMLCSRIASYNMSTAA